MTIQQTTMVTAEQVVRAAAELHAAVNKLTSLYQGTAPRIDVTEHGVSIGFDNAEGVAAAHELLVHDLAHVFGVPTELHIDADMWMQLTVRGEHDGIAFCVHHHIAPNREVDR